MAVDTATLWYSNKQNWYATAVQQSIGMSAASATVQLIATANKLIIKRRNIQPITMLMAMTTAVALAALQRSKQ